MKSFITNNDIPIGYETPPFPSLFWPTNLENTFHVLYDVYTIWRFTFYWSLIFNLGVYGITGLWASFSHRKQTGAPWIFALYCVYGGIQAVASGTIIGFLIGSIYTAGLFSMSTWIPFCCVVVQILFDLTVSYSGTAVMM